MVPVNEFNRLSNYYQNKITESALLDKAGRLAAEQQLILQDKNIPDSMAVQIVKPMALQQGRLVKRVRTGTAAPAQYEGVEEPEGMADAPAERLLKEIIKGVQQQPQVIEIDTPDKPVKKRSPKTSVKKKYKPSKRPPKHLSGSSAEKKLIPQGLSPRANEALKDLGWLEDVDSPKPTKGAVKPKKKRKTEVEQLREGWEPWNKPGKRGALSYDTDEED